MVAFTEYLPLTSTWARIAGIPLTLRLEANASDVSVIHLPARAFLGALPEIVTRPPGRTIPGVAVTELEGGVAPTCAGTGIENAPLLIDCFGPLSTDTVMVVPAGRVAEPTIGSPGVATPVVRASPLLGGVGGAKKPSL